MCFVNSMKPCKISMRQYIGLSFQYNMLLPVRIQAMTWMETELKSTGVYKNSSAKL